MCRYGAPPARPSSPSRVSSAETVIGVGRLALAVEVDHDVEDRLVGRAVEVGGTHDLDNVGDRVLAQQHAADDRLLGGDVLRRGALELAGRAVARLTRKLDDPVRHETTSRVFASTPYGRSLGSSTGHLRQFRARRASPSGPPVDAAGDRVGNGRRAPVDRRPHPGDEAVGTSGTERARGAVAARSPVGKESSPPQGSRGRPGRAPLSAPTTRESGPAERGGSRQPCDRCPGRSPRRGQGTAPSETTKARPPKRGAEPS